MMMPYECIIITRPVPGHERLIQYLKPFAKQIIWAPVLDIQKLKISTRMPECIDDLLMISPAAVKYAPLDCLARAKRLWVMGKGSAAHLPKHFHHKLQFEQGALSSETLISKLLDKENWQNRQVMLLKGNAGRKTLPNFFEKKGAILTTVPVYQSTLNRRMSFSFWKNMPPSLNIVVQVSSLDILRGLIHILGPTGCDWLRECTLLVSGKQQAQIIQKMKFIQHSIIAKTASVEDIAEALNRSDKMV